MNNPELVDQEHAPRVNVYEVRPAEDRDGFDLISSALSTGRIHFSKQHVAVGYATLHSGSRASVIRVYDRAGELVETREQAAARAQTSSG